MTPAEHKEIRQVQRYIQFKQDMLGGHRPRWRSRYNWIYRDVPARSLVIARRLKDRGITGQISSCDQCPLALYYLIALREAGFRDISVTVSATVLLVRLPYAFIRMPLTEPEQGFITQFDARMHPHLIAQ